MLSGAGIAVGNVLMPAVVKDHFARRTGLFTGLTMTLMALFGALAAGAAVPLCAAAGWQFALAVWAVPAALAAMVWGCSPPRGVPRRPARIAGRPPRRRERQADRCWTSATAGGCPWPS